MIKTKATIYLLHFEKPYRGKSQHYLRYTTLPLEKRLECHRNGSGATTTAYAKKKGISFVLAYSKEFNSKKEARMAEIKAKRTGRIKDLCPICRGNPHKE